MAARSHGVDLSLVDDTLFSERRRGIDVISGGGISVANSILDDASAGPECNDASPTTATTWPRTTRAASARPASRTRRPSARSRWRPTARPARRPRRSPSRARPSASCRRARAPRRPTSAASRDPASGRPPCDAGAYEYQKSTGYDLAGSDGGVFVFPTGQPYGLLRLAAGPRDPRQQRRGPRADEQLHTATTWPAPTAGSSSSRSGRARATTARCPASGSRSTTSSAWCRRTTTPATTSSGTTAASSSSRPASPRASTARCPGLGVQSTTSWASWPRRAAAATSWSAATVASSPSATRHYYGSLPGKGISVTTSSPSQTTRPARATTWSARTARSTPSVTR